MINFHLQGWFVEQIQLLSSVFSHIINVVAPSEYTHTSPSLLKHTNFPPAKKALKQRGRGGGEGGLQSGRPASSGWRLATMLYEVINETSPQSLPPPSHKPDREMGNTYRTNPKTSSFLTPPSPPYHLYVYTYLQKILRALDKSRSFTSLHRTPLF